jgi:hypothetical protein
LCRLMRPGGYLVISISVTEPSDDTKGPPYYVSPDIISDKLRGSGKPAQWSLVYPYTPVSVGGGEKQMIVVWEKKRFPHN